MSGLARIALAVAALFTLSPVPALAAQARASLTDVENDVMCVACHESLAVAQSPQASSERDYIRQLIAQGLTKPQIERQLVSQYGPSVLALPPAHGFNLVVYVLPPGVVAVGLATIAFTLPKWRRRTRERAAQPLPSGPGISAEDAQRLERDLARFER